MATLSSLTHGHMHTQKGMRGYTLTYTQAKNTHKTAGIMGLVLPV